MVFLGLSRGFMTDIAVIHLMTRHNLADLLMTKQAMSRALIIIYSNNITCYWKL